MKTNYKKILRFVTLLATSLLIATASAGVYRSFMYMQGTIQIGSKEVVWIDKDGREDPDDTIDITLAGIEPNRTLIFNNTAYIKNKGSSPHNIISIEVVDRVSDFEMCTAYVYTNCTGGDWTLVGTLDLEDTSASITPTEQLKTLESNECYRFDFVIRVSKSTVQDASFAIEVTYE